MLSPYHCRPMYPDVVPSSCWSFLVSGYVYVYPPDGCQVCQCTSLRTVRHELDMTTILSHLRLTLSPLSCSSVVSQSPILPISHLLDTTMQLSQNLKAALNITVLGRFFIHKRITYWAQGCWVEQ